MKRAKKIISLIITASMAFTILPVQIKNTLADDKDKIINFNDENFKEILIECKVDSNNDGEISIKEMENLKELNIPSSYFGGKKINNMQEIHYAYNLKELFIGSNVLKGNIDFLKNLNNLEILYIDRENKIKDITSLSNLINLKTLDLSGNQIEDITPLSNLTNLKSLNLSENKIKDITSLKNLDNLIINGSINLNYNNISNSNEELINILAGKKFILKKGASKHDFAGNIDTIFSGYLKMTNNNDDILKIDFKNIIIIVGHF